VINMVRFISPIVESGGKIREGKGFSLAELKEVELTAGRAKRMGIPVDTRRKSLHDENVEALKEFLESTKDLDLRVPKPKFESKYIPRRVFRGKTSAGKKMRNLSRRK